MIKRFLHIILFVFLCCLTVNAQTEQQFNVESRVDTSQGLIGDWFTVTVKTPDISSINVIFPNLTDSIGSMEIIEQLDVDSIRENEQDFLEKSYIVTAWDSGLYQMPAIPILINQQGKIDSLMLGLPPIAIGYIQIDTSKGIADIKDISKLPMTKDEKITLGLTIGGIVLGIILLIVLIYFIARWIGNRPKQDEKEPEEIIAAHEWAWRELEKLEKDKTWETGELKDFYSRLSEIGRTYIERRYEFQAMESTTPEILKWAKKMKLPKDIITKLEMTLSESDLVKFAQYSPEEDIHQSAINNVYFLVNETKEVIAKEIEE